MKKRVLSLLLLAFVLCGTLFTACTPSEENVSESESAPESVSQGEVSENVKTEKDYPVLCGSFMQPGAFKGHSLSRMKEHRQQDSYTPQFYRCRSRHESNRCFFDLLHIPCK